MIDRRAVIFGLASLPLAKAAAAADDRTRKLRDIPYTPIEDIPNHRKYMRDIVGALSTYARARNPDFVLLARNAPELLIKEQREWDWETGRDIEGAAMGKYSPVGSVIRPYLKAIDGLLIDGLFYGRDKVDQPTEPAEAQLLLTAAAALHNEGRRVFTIEYCKDPKMQSTVAKKASQAKVLATIDGAGDKRLGRIPPGRPATENADHVTRLAQVRNMLPMLHSERYESRDAWVAALADTNYDMLVIDPFWRGTEPLTPADIAALRYKKMGSRRLVVATLSIGEAFEGRYYWNADWQVGTPDWLVATDPDNPSQTVVRYWVAEWKGIIGKYMQGLMDSGFDGVLYDHIDAYRYFEELMPLK